MKTYTGWAFRVLFGALFAALAVIAPQVPATASGAADCTAIKGAATEKLHRMYHGGIGDHFYTTSWPEAMRAFNELGYTYEGVQAMVAPESAQVGTALYRLYSGEAGNHFYTTGWDEAVYALNHYGYTYEGVQAKVWADDSCGQVPLYRLYHGGIDNHFYTTDWEEAKRAFNEHGYTYEGIQAYVFSA